MCIFITVIISTMSFIGILLLSIFVWVAYNFITKLVLPVYFTTKRVKEQFRNMQQQQEAAQQQQAPPQDAPKEKVGEYIEFEEVK